MTTTKQKDGGQSTSSAARPVPTPGPWEVFEHLGTFHVDQVAKTGIPGIATISSLTNGSDAAKANARLLGSVLI